MEVKTRSSKIVKPLYEGNPPSTEDTIRLSVFDKITYNTHIAVIYAYRPPTSTNEAIEVGLCKVLAVYRAWAGRLGKDVDGILLNDEGVKFVEAYVDSTLDAVLPFKPSPTLLSLHPSLEPRVCPWDIDESHDDQEIKDSSEGVVQLVQVQLTRFTCDSLVVGFTAHHLVADGYSTSNFLVAWGQACRGLKINPLPCHDRTPLNPRNPPIFEFEHKGFEFISRNHSKVHNNLDHDSIVDNIVVHKVHYTVEFLTKLKAKASLMNGNNNKPYSTFESLLAHLWRAITKSRRLNGHETTHVRISVDGRRHLSKVPNDYFGNLVLWAFPTTNVKTLLQEPLSYAAKLIHDAIIKVDENYFKSFIDFANFKAKEENLKTSVDITKHVYWPNVEVDSWLRFPFYELDFGRGPPYSFMPFYYPAEGVLFFLPSFIGDGSIDV